MGMGTFFSIRLSAFNRVNLALLVGSQSLHPIVAKSFFPDDFIFMLPTVCSFGEKEKDKEGNEKKDSGELEFDHRMQNSGHYAHSQKYRDHPSVPLSLLFWFCHEQLEKLRGYSIGLVPFKRSMGCRLSKPHHFKTYLPSRYWARQASVPSSL